MQFKKQQFRDVLRQLGARIISVLMVLGIVGASSVFAEKKCEPVDKKASRLKAIFLNLFANKESGSLRNLERSVPYVWP